MPACRRSGFDAVPSAIRLEVPDARDKTAVELRKRFRSHGSSRRTPIRRHAHAPYTFLHAGARPPTAEVILATPTRLHATRFSTRSLKAGQDLGKVDGFQFFFFAREQSL